MTLPNERRSARVVTLRLCVVTLFASACNVRVPANEETTTEPLPDLPSEDDEETGPSPDLPNTPEWCWTVVGAGFDCGEGERCTTMFVEGSLESVCTPMAADPLPLGAECEEFEPFMGPDPCEQGLACRTHPWLGTKRCVSHCGIGDGMYWTCDVPGEVCDWTVLAEGDTCKPLCDPFGADCPEGRSCGSGPYGPTCVLDAELGSAQLHQPCNLEDRCAPGLACVFAFAVDECAGELCCTPQCDAEHPCAEGEVCSPKWPSGMAAAPGGFETLGACASG